MSAIETGRGPILDWLAARRSDMESLLQSIVDIDSGSADPEGIEQVAATLADFLTGHGVRVNRLPTPSGASLLEAQVADCEGRAVPLLLGHMDTVFPRGTAARRPFRAEADRLHGPGVADMKGGLVMNAFVLAAFARCGAGRHPLRALFTTDEEIASPASKRFIVQAALDASIALNAEPGRVSGNIVISRKGGIFMRLTITGRAAHAGVDFSAGASAISELAHKIIALEALTDIPAGITVNVGLVSGGRSINTVAPDAAASIDIRYLEGRQRAELIARVSDIVRATKARGTHSELEIIGEFQVMSPSAASLALLETYRRSGRTLGFDVDGEATGSCSDAGFTASVGTPTLCGLGPVGGKAHTDQEYIERDTLPLRAQALALTILNHKPDTAEDARRHGEVAARQ